MRVFTLAIRDVTDWLDWVGVLVPNWRQKLIAKRSTNPARMTLTKPLTGNGAEGDGIVRVFVAVVLV